MGVAILGNVKFTVGWLYPDLMNIYGDRGNILTLLRRAEWHGFEYVRNGAFSLYAALNGGTGEVEE